MELLDITPAVPPEGTSARAVLPLRLAALQLTKADLTSATFTLYDRDSRTIINGRNNFNVLQAVSAQGELVLIFDDSDNVIVDSSKLEETHIARIEWTWNAGYAVLRGIQEYHFRVYRLLQPIEI